MFTRWIIIGSLLLPSVLAHAADPSPPPLDTPTELQALENSLWPEELIAADSSVASIPNALRRGASLALNLRKDNAYWNLPAYLGTHYISQYYLLLQYLGLSAQSKLDPQRLRSLLLTTQLGDGSWYAIVDKNIPEGDLNATILNYWALKAMGEPVDSSTLKSARTFILKKGGLDSSMLFTKIFLALFGNASWKNVPFIPNLIFEKNALVSEQQFAQWIGPHLLPIAYLSSVRATKFLGPQFNLDELRLQSENLEQTPRAPSSSDQKLVKFMLERQQPHGSWGGYTVSSLLTLCSFDHFLKYANKVRALNSPLRAQINSAAMHGLQFIEERYFESEESSYLGVLDDGRYWDTALIAIALLEAGLSPQKLKETAQYLLASQTPSGGYPFGFDFGYAPDTDDTAEILLFLARFPEYKANASQSIRWLLSMQNEDGGWGAFDKNNTGNAVLKFFTERFRDSADLFDESSADVSGHILEALGTYGMNVNNSEQVRAAVSYLKESQNQDEYGNGSWEGRWGINRIYGTSAAIVGLLKVGETPATPWIAAALRWLIAHQNVDGGFGESSLSYQSQADWGRGMSTPSQTAWTLLALTEAGLAQTPPAMNAAQYLARFIRDHGKWFDPSTTGTGHPGVIYMDYPSYPLAFSLTAMARYKRALSPNSRK